MKPVLSIIVPIYNVERYLCQCIESILSQTFIDFELILVDDGSTDKSSYLCDDYSIKDLRIKVIHKINGGLVSARKAGLDIAVGEYIGFVDGDDWIEPDMYEKLYKSIKRDEDIVICGFYINYPDKELVLSQDNLGFHDKESLIKNIYPTMLYKDGYYNFGIMPTLCNKIIKHELILKHLSNVDNEITIGEDAACTFPCILEANAVYIIGDCFLYHYRQNRYSMTKSYRSNYFETNLRLFSLLKKSFMQNGYSTILDQLQYYIVYLTILAIINEMSDTCKKSLSEKIRYINRNLSVSIIIDAFYLVDKKRFPPIYRIYINLILYKLIDTLIFIWSIKKSLLKNILHKQIKLE